MAGPFELALSEFAAKAGDKADQAVRQVVLELASRIIVRSPVDTGRFRANWRLGVGAAKGGTTEATDKTGEGANAAIAAALPANATAQVLVLSNNLPYAWALETGHSNQAPAGMVGLTALEFAPIVDEAVRKVAP